MKIFKKETKEKFYNLKDILKMNAHYNIIFGERSCGKTFAVNRYFLTRFMKTGEPFVIIRRFASDKKKTFAETYMNPLASEGIVKDLTKGEFDDIYYFGGKFYLSKLENGLRKNSHKPIAYLLTLWDAQTEHNKGLGLSNVSGVVFDEFMTRETYLTNEFVTFANLISSIVRNREDVPIFLLGNSVDLTCPYFREMGLHNPESIQPGTIQLYTYGESELRVAVERTSPNDVSCKTNNFLFAFDNPQLNMITEGAWEFDIYPHLPFKYDKKKILFKFFVLIEEYILQCEFLDCEKEGICLFVHEKTTDLKDPDNDLIYSKKVTTKLNWRRRIGARGDRIEQKIMEQIRNERIFYQDNRVGELFNKFLKKD